MGNVFHSIEDVLSELMQGKLVIVVDDKDRENEGDLICLGTYCTPVAINFMVTHGRGLVCAPMSVDVARRLELAPMSSWNSDPLGTAFTVSVDHKDTSTGISAFDRSLTIRSLASPGSEANGFHSPGHVFPLVAQEGGVLLRPGHTEAAVDLARLCGAAPVAAICEILDADGTMARLPNLLAFARFHQLKITSIARLIAYKNSGESANTRTEVHMMNAP